jgi:hypothetical protein
MPPIWAGSSALSREAPRDSGGPSSGDGAGYQSMFNGLLFGGSYKMFAEVIVDQLKKRRRASVEAFICVSATLCMMVLQQ